jgi:hypothetical protein
MIDVLYNPKSQIRIPMTTLIECQTRELGQDTPANLKNYGIRLKLSQLCFDRLNNQQKA